MTMADRIAIMDKGEVVQVATPAEVYEAPNSRFVADFVGNVNMFEGVVEHRDEASARIAGKGGLIIEAHNPGEVEKGANVWFAIRPEKMRVSTSPPESPVNAASGEIWDIAYLGDMTVYHVRLEDGTIVKTSAMNAVRATEGALTWQDKAWISFAPDAGVVLVR